MNGRILAANDFRKGEIPVHPNCKCYVEALTAIAAGTATNTGADGVDMYVALYGMLPDCYMTDAEAKAQGRKKWLGNLAEVWPGRMMAERFIKIAIIDYRRWSDGFGMKLILTV